MSKDLRSKTDAFKILKEIAKDSKLSEEKCFDKQISFEVNKNNSDNPLSGESSPAHNISSTDLRSRSVLPMEKKREKNLNTTKF